MGSRTFKLITVLFFIHLTREVNSWVKSLHNFCRPVMDMEKGTFLDHFIYQKPALISPTAHAGFRKGIRPYTNTLLDKLITVLFHST